MSTATLPRYHGKKAAVLSSLNRVLARHIRYSANGQKVVGHATIDDRNKVLAQFIRDLHGLGFEIRDVHNLNRKHIDAIARLWETRAYSASTLQKRFSHLATLCKWIGKPNLIGDPRVYFHNPEVFKRTYVATEDKSWQAKGRDRAEVIAAIAAKDPTVAVQIKLQDAFGLRVQESLQLRPHLADQGTILDVRWGTKGGRPRWVAITSDAQRAVLAEAKRFAARREHSTMPRTRTLASGLNHYHYIVRRYGGVCRKQGITSHGLRHGYANDRYEAVTGHPSPVRGGTGVGLDPDLERLGREVVSNELGHGRIGITAAYYGPLHPKTKPPTAPAVAKDDNEESGT